MHLNIHNAQVKEYPFDLPLPTGTKTFEYDCLYVYLQLSKIHYLVYQETRASFKRLGYGRGPEPRAQ